MRSLFRLRTFSKRSFILACATGLGLGLLQCGLVSDTMTVSGESHFLKVCAASSECGSAELSCICNVCTKPCSAANECSALGAKTACVDSTCAGGGNVCYLGCVTNDDCSPLGNEHQCIDQVCRPAVTPSEPNESPSSGGTSGSTGDGTNGGTGGNTDPPRPHISRLRPPTQTGSGGFEVMTPIEPPTGGHPGSGGSGGSSEPPCLAAPAGLVAWWTGDDDATDLLGTNHGTLIGGALAGSEAWVDGGLSFDGTGYVEVSSGTDLDFGTGPFSIAFWIRTTQADVGMILGKLHDGGAEVRGYQAWLESGQLHFEFAAQTSQSFASGPVINDGHWHFVVITVNRTAPDGLTLYVDGLAEGFHDISFASGAVDNTNPLRIGVHAHQLDNHFTGDLDEVQFYETVLGVDDVGAMYTVGTLGMCKDVP